MQTEEIALAKPVDYDELTLTGSQQDVDGSDLMETDIKKDKSRRYWTPKEEDRFFEIWGRENWRLTKHGKNTIYFSQWSKELKERYDVDVKPEEIQAKVNQTRAKFRQVKKTLEADNSATKWKKYDIIDKILKNQYRSDGDEPIPKEALENNRDMSPNSLSNSISLNSTQDGLTMPHNASTGLDVDAMGIDVDHNLSAGLFSDPQIKHNYSTELFTDQYSSDVKPEFEEDFQNYAGYPTEQNHYVNNATDEHQLHQLQTPQQLQQQTIYSNPAEAVAVAPGAETALLHPQHHLQQHIEHLRQQNQPQVPTHYEPVNNATYTNLSTPNQYTNGGAYAGNYNETGGLAVGHSEVAPVVGVEGGAMQPPRPAAAATPAAPPPPPTTAAPAGRKRGRPFLPANLPNAQGHTAAGSGSSSAASTTPVDGLESQYLEQVRKKNIILEEQRDISRKRLEVEERKAKLMAEFFPKMFNLQKEILSKLSSATTNTNDNP